MKRRSFVKYTSIATISVLVPVYSCNSIGQKDNALSLPINLLNIMSDDDVAELGNSYLLTFPEEANADILKALIVQNKNIPSKKIIDQKVKFEINDDFVKGDTVILNGWVLSKTEARQCALYSLIQ